MSQELLNAINSRNLTKVKDLLSNPEIDINFTGAHPSKPNTKVTPLSLAILLEEIEIAKVIFDKGALVSEKGSNRYTYPDLYSKVGDKIRPFFC